MEVSAVRSEEQPSKKAASQENVAKSPPTETTKEMTTRRLVMLSFWAIVLLVGLPVWWKTTEVYRAGLPLSHMTDWAEGKVRKHF